MNEDNTEKLFERFKFYRPEKSIRESLMAFGFEHGDGWFNIIWELSEALEDALSTDGPSQHTDAEEPFNVEQVKEKFGGLRFYTNWETKKIRDLIMKAEKKSYKTCERCGEPGKQRDGGWIVTLCDKCERK